MSIYEPFVWIDDDPGNDIDGTEFTAERMNHMEIGIGSAHVRIDMIELTPGPPGDPGTPGTDGDDGQGFRWRGEWDPEGEYLPYDVAEYGGSTWVCIAYTAFGVEPPGAPTEWELSAASGAVGPQGPAGVGSGAVGGVLDGTLPNPGLASGVAASALSGVFAGLADPRFTDARIPTGAAGGILDGTYPNPGFASATASGALAPYFIGVGQPPVGPVGGILAGSLPNPGMASAVVGSAIASGFGPNGTNRRLYLEAGLGTGSANVGNSVRLSWGSGAVAEVYGLAASGAAAFSATAGTDDDFTTDTSANYTERVGVIGDWIWSTANSQLRPTGTGTKNRLLTLNNAGVLTDHRIDWLINRVSSTDGSRIIRWVIKWIDANNYLYFEWDDGGAGTVKIVEFRGGVRTELQTLTGAIAMIPDNTTRWTRAQIVGNVCTFSYYGAASDPEAGGSPTNTVTFTLTGTQATVFGQNVAGRVGIVSNTSASVTVFQPYFDRVRHYTLLAPQNMLRVRIKTLTGGYVDRLLLDGLGRTDLAGLLGL